MKRLLFILSCLLASKSFAVVTDNIYETCFTDLNICGMRTHGHVFGEIVSFVVRESDFTEWSEEGKAEYADMGINVLVYSDSTYASVRSKVPNATEYVSMNTELEKLGEELHQAHLDSWLEGGACVLAVGGCAYTVYGTAGLALLVSKYTTCGGAAFMCVKARSTLNKWRKLQKEMSHHVRERNKQILAPHLLPPEDRPPPRPAPLPVPIPSPTVPINPGDRTGVVTGSETPPSGGDPQPIRFPETRPLLH